MELEAPTDLTQDGASGDTRALPTMDHMTMDQIGAVSETLSNVLEAYRKEVTKPSAEKQAPQFNATQLAELCGKSSDQMFRLLDGAQDRGLPTGTAPEGKGRSRLFSWADCHKWIRHVRHGNLRPEGKQAAVISVAIFKGGAGKTVIAASLGQALTTKGYRVLMVDTDPQGSLTSLLGVDPVKVPEDQTAAPITLLQHPESERHPDARSTLKESVRPTYWAGLDLIPGNYALFQGEFLLPLRQMRARQYERDFMFYNVFAQGLDSLRSEYDYIILDTPPALSYMTLAAHWAADALLMPVPPEGIDFVSSGEFLGMLEQVASATTGKEKTFSWIRAVPSKVNRNTLYTGTILSMMKAGFGPLLSSVELPLSAAVNTLGALQQTVYDVNKYLGDRRTLQRARAAFDALADEVDGLTQKNVWGRPAA